MSDASRDAGRREKRAAALAAVREVEDGMLVGLGTGTTAAFAIREIARRVADGLRIEAVATSRASEAMARDAGIMVIPFDDVRHVDLAIDGVDEIDDALRAIKGAGGAMLREKIVATASLRMIVVADGSKKVVRIGKAKLPVEILPFARAFVADRLASAGGAVALRHGADGAPYHTDQGNLVLDCAFPAMADPAALAVRISAIPGVLGHGLFLDEIDALYLAEGERVTRLERPGGKPAHPMRF